MAKEPTENSAAEEGAEPKKAAAKTTTSKKAAPKIEETPVEKKTEVVAAEETVADVQVADTTVDVAVKEDKKASTKKLPQHKLNFYLALTGTTIKKVLTSSKTSNWMNLKNL